MEFITGLTTLTNKWFYKLIQEGKFPKPIKLSRRPLWLKSKVEQWLRQKIKVPRAEVSA
ncbi:helix-turn-helix transcriptional regulator [Paenalcaligenes hominis]|uniref:helix-turn-helix transcriptional regulator n=1 Tax=Paenalcaligenes hominis TaxID=643674 RepID=UPI003524AEC4